MEQRHLQNWRNGTHTLSPNFSGDSALQENFTNSESLDPEERQGKLIHSQSYVLEVCILIKISENYLASHKDRILMIMLKTSLIC